MDSIVSTHTGGVAERRAGFGHAVWTLAVLVAANLLGWLVFVRIEAATALAGAGLFVLNLRPNPGDDGRLWLRAVGGMLFFAGLFDYFDIGADGVLGDWGSGALTGGLLLLPPVVLAWVFAGPKSLGAPPSGLSRLTVSATLWVILLVSFAESRQWVWLLEHFSAAIGGGVSIVLQRHYARKIHWRHVAADGLALHFCALAADRLLAGNLTGLLWGVAGAVLAHSAHLADGRATPAKWTGRIIGMTGAIPRAAVWFALIWFGVVAALGSYLNDSPSRMLASHDLLVPMSEDEFAEFMLRDVYLWPNAVKATTATEVLRGLERIQEPKDRFSGMMSEAMAKSYARYHGMDSTFTHRGRMVAYVSPFCDLARRGFRRGYRDVSRVHDKDGYLAAYNDRGGEHRKEDLFFSSIPDRDCTRLENQVFEWDGQRVGYLYFPKFSGMFSDELKTRFAEFHEAGVNELVLDLRYNPGGALYMSARLASLIAGDRAEEKLFMALSYPERYRDQNRKVHRLKRPKNPLGLKRLIVLTTRQTCSASEALINGLRPHMEVVTIGATTCGKPAGFAPMHFKGSVFRVIEFEVVNERKQGRYYDGIPADCPVTDDLTIESGTTMDPHIRAARALVVDGACAAGAGTELLAEH